MVLTDDGVERVLVVVAHPDDADFGSAGTVATWVRAGVEVAYCLVTDGDAGGFDPNVPREHIPQIRRDEQRRAAATLGVNDVCFLGYPDGRLYVTHELRRDITRQIRRVRPQRVITQAPERNYSRVYASHPDHLAAGEAALCAVYPDARNAFAHPDLLAEEGLKPWAVAEVLLMTDRHPDVFIDVTDVYDVKVAALRCHASQMVNIADLDGLLRPWLTSQALAGGLGLGRLAEAFRRVDTAG
ncbi:MAG: PIG-L deacetylase family protein [Frankiaceae bacterium]